MPTFPSLKTNAVAQYPAARRFRFQNQTLRFVDGRQQRYRDAAGPLLRWEIRLDQLDEGELAAVEAFFTENQGAFGSFSFTDPGSGHVYPTCSLQSDGMTLLALAELRGRTMLTVIETRG